MKHLKSIITLIILTFTLASCSTDDDGGSNNVSEENLIGTWSLTSSTEENSFSGDVQGTEFNAEITSTGSNFDLNIIFSDDNVVLANGSYDITIVSDFDGEVTTESDTITVNNAEGEWALEGDQLTLTGEPATTTGDLEIIGAASASIFTITTLNETTLTLRLEGDQDLGVEGLSSMINVVQTYTRVN
ncbi:lipocalin family protein [uncultured Dokdonia sp.]|uniref:lipocalin family protein n=1 Tax=uncultured Dokdonia sp. TaxID=575653 RepID=UPI0030EB72E8|tara:strand:- start:9837 stop:10400 length:564 start_codon:yes stop_codon:yes gene_type:complete